jgi:hypothetical protein
MNDPVTLVPAWRRNDAKINKDATDFWLRLGALPPGVSPEQRLRELCAAAYVGDELVGVSTIELRQSPVLRCRLGFYRCLVNPAHGHRRIVNRLTHYSRALLENWSKENPDEKVLGMAAILENPNFDRLAKRPMWHGTDLWLIGYTQDGQQVRLTWFEHARLE